MNKERVYALQSMGNAIGVGVHKQYFMNMLSLETILRVKDSEGNKIRWKKGRGFSEGYVVSLVTPTNWVWLEGAYEWNITQLGAVSV